jgi:hypothetical protein
MLFLGLSTKGQQLSKLFMAKLAAIYDKNSEEPARPVGLEQTIEHEQAKPELIHDIGKMAASTLRYIRQLGFKVILTI